jgi:hypothetical protein
MYSFQKILTCVLFEIARFLMCLSEIAIMRQLASPCPSVNQSVRSISKHDGRVLIKFGPGELYKNLWLIQFRSQSKKITGTSLEFLHDL